MGTVEGYASHQNRSDTSFTWTTVVEKKPKSSLEVDTSQAILSGHICFIICFLIFSILCERSNSTNFVIFSPK